MTDQGPRTSRASACLLVTAFVLTGCAHGSPGASGPEPGRTDDVGAAYAAALAGLDRRYFGGMEMSAPTQMQQDLVVSAGGADQMVAEWEGELAAGAAAARLRHPSRLSRVDVFEHPAGQATPAEEEYGYRVTLHPVAASGYSDAALGSRATAVLREFHLTPSSVRVLHPLGPAVVAEAATDDVASVHGRMGDLERALAARLPGLDGLYVAVSGPDGPVFRGETAARIAEGGQWFAPGFDSGIPHG